MLISFSVENFRSFRDKVELRMDATADTDLPHVVRQVEGLPKDSYGLLPVVSIHGANASGKSNLFKAMRMLKSILYATTPIAFIGTPENPFSPLRALDPFRLNEEGLSRPVQFDVVFLIDGVRWAYGLHADGQKIHAEWLLCWPNGRQKEVFLRGNAINKDRKAWLLSRSEDPEITQDSPGVFRVSPSIQPHLPPEVDPKHWQEGLAGDAQPDQEAWIWGDEFSAGESEGRSLAGRTLPQVAFLTVAASWNNPQAKRILGWFARLWTLDAADGARPIEMVARACHENKDLRAWTEQWMRAADLGISSITVDKKDLQRPDPDGGTTSWTQHRAQAVHRTDSGKEVVFDLQQQESHGTNRLFAMSRMLYSLFQNGGVLVADELHAGLHPLLLRALVKMFQDPKRNPHHAQLIFTTHDVSVLDNSLLRRDQMSIVEKDRTGTSTLYSLSDFQGDEKPRKDSPLLKYYLSGRLGGTPDLDLDELFGPPATAVDGGHA